MGVGKARRVVGGVLTALATFVLVQPAAVSQDRAAAQLSAAEAAPLFGAREAIEQISLSPDGTKLAYLTPAGGQASAIMIADLVAGGEPKAIIRSTGDPERLSGCRWVGNARLFCTMFGIVRVEGDVTYATRMVALDTDGSDVKLLGNRRGSGDRLGYSLYGGSVIDWNPGEENAVLMIRESIPESTTGTRLAQTDEGLGVDLVRTDTLVSKVRERADRDASEFITDGRGVVRVKGRRIVDSASGLPTGETRYFYRTIDSREWKPLSTVTADGKGFDPHVVDPDLNVAYGLKRHEGRLAAFSVALDGSGAEKLLFAHPQVDVSGFTRVGRRSRVIGVRYVTDVSQVQYIDPALDKLHASLTKALGNLPLIRFVDSSEDERKLLIWAGSDTDPGRYYLFNRDARKLEELMLARPMLSKLPLATVKPVSYPAADGTMIPGYLTLPPGGAARNLPTLVMPHGGPGSRDVWGFDWLAQYFASQGYAVLQPNFRGSTGYGDAWFQRNGFQNWEIAIGDVTDGGRWLIAQGIADPKRLAIFGWSYGGYAALQSGVVAPDLFKAIVAVAPVTDLERLKEDRRGWSDYRMVSQFVGSGPHIDAGSPARHADRIKVPVLMFHGDLDRNVSISQARLMQSRLESAGARSELVVYDGLDHYLDDSSARTKMLAKSATFLEAAFKR